MSNPKRVSFGVLIGVLVGLYGNWLLFVGQKIFELDASDFNYSICLISLIIFFIISIYPLNPGVSRHMTFREKLGQFKLAYGFHIIILLI